MPRPKGGRISLTAFEATWLTMVLDLNLSDACAALEHLDMRAPKGVNDDPETAWKRIIDKVAAVSPDTGE